MFRTGDRQQGYCNTSHQNQYFLDIYSIRMAGVFMMSTGTIWVRTRLMPRWLAIFTYLIALVLLISINLTQWVTLLFPFWVLVISIYILTRNLRRLDSGQVTQAAEEA